MSMEALIILEEDQDQNRADPFSAIKLSIIFANATWPTSIFVSISSAMKFSVTNSTHCENLRIFLWHWKSILDEFFFKEA